MKKQKEYERLLSRNSLTNYWEGVRYILFKRSKIIYWVGGVQDRFPFKVYGKPAIYFNNWTDLNN